MSADPFEFESKTHRGPGPIVLVLPLLAFAAGLIWFRQHRGPRTGERPPAPMVQESVEVSGWVGEAAPAPGARLDVRLVPLHNQVERQDFDRDVLSARLGRDGGAPWRVLLRYAGDPADGAPNLSLDGLELRDQAGGLLRPAVSAAPAPAEDASADPLQALLAVPVELSPGEAVTIVLWGPAPGEGAWLDLGSIVVPLHAQKIPSDAVPRSLAGVDRLERGVVR